MRYEVIDNFLMPEQCAKLIDMATPRLERSGGWDLKTMSTQYTDYRNSSQMFFRIGENNTIRMIEAKIAELTGIPVENGEGMQVLKYLPGQHYKVHWDFFDPRFPGNEPVLRNGGQRLATVLMYLNDVEEGGHTHFPKMNLTVEPKEGRAIFWWNVDPDTKELDFTSFHEGQDVIKGEKYIATKWLRERRYA